MWLELLLNISSHIYGHLLNLTYQIYMRILSFFDLYLRIYLNFRNCRRRRLALELGDWRMQRYAALASPPSFFQCSNSYTVLDLLNGSVTIAGHYRTNP